MSIIFIILGIVGLSIPTYFGAQTLISIILLVLGAGWLLIFGIIFIAALVGAGSSVVSVNRSFRRTRGRFPR